MSLQDLINDDVESVFLADDSFAEDATLYVKGVGFANLTGGTPIRVVWWEDELAATSTSSGGTPDGRLMNNKDGRSERQTAFLEMARSVEITPIQDDRAPDVIVRNSTGQAVKVKRIVSADHAMMTVAAIHHAHVKRFSGGRD